MQRTLIPRSPGHHQHSGPDPLESGMHHPLAPLGVLLRVRRFTVGSDSLPTFLSKAGLAASGPKVGAHLEP